MGYHRSLARSRGGYQYARGRGGFSLGGLIKGVGKVAGAVLSATPVGRVVSTGLSLGSQLLGARTTASPGLVLPPSMPGLGGPVQVPTRQQQQHGVEAVGVSPLGTVGVRFRKHHRMNAGNAKAARRAIRRIKAVRHLLQGIERELPKRAAPRIGGSRGVITRAEAARALRA